MNRFPSDVVADLEDGFRSVLQTPTPTRDTTDRSFDLCAGTLTSDDLHVVAFCGRMAMNELYAFDIDLRFDSDDDDLEDQLLGQPARLTMTFEGRSASVAGIVAAVSLRGVHADGGVVGTLRIVPRMARLEHTQASRIFQDRTVVEIVDAVLEHHGIARDWRLSRTYPPREYCVQYQESDYAFVTRMLAEEGIMFFFRPPAAAEVGADISLTLDTTESHETIDASAGVIDSEQLVLVDAPIAYPDLPGGCELTYRAHGNGFDPEASVSTFSIGRSTAPESLLMRQYDFRRPLLDLSWRSWGTQGGPDGPSSALIYEHHADYQVPDVTRNVAPVRLEQCRARAVDATGTSACRRLWPGHTFLLQEHPIPRLNDSYVVTHVEIQEHAPHVGPTDAGRHSPEDDRDRDVPDYAAAFHCVPAAVAFRPPRPVRGPRQMVETAVVVGPSDDEIHTDPLGRIKVQFHWDLEGGRNQYSSCFMRVVQGNWAGAGWGFQFIPRIGMEVLVAFIGGDLDNPVVIGALNNALNPTTHLVPNDKTWSGIRTQTTPGGDGYNQLAFNDQAGSEEVYLRAQRDLRELVQNDRQALVGKDDRERVMGDQTIDVTGDQRIVVQGDQATQVGGDQRTMVTGDRLDVVNGRGELDYVKDLVLNVSGNEHRRIAGTAREHVKGDATRRIAGDATTLVVGETPRASLVHVDGTSRMTSTGMTEIVSDKEVVIRCGKSVLRVMPNGIELVAPEVRVRAPGAGIKFAENTMEIRAKDGAAFKAKEVVMQSDGAKLKLDAAASVEAPRIQLGTSPSKLDDAKDDSEKATKIELKDPKDRPISSQHYVVVTKKGERIGGMVGKDGKDEIYLEEGDEIVFPDLGKVEDR
jgi:type VI secretion system secreted protein VgrG